MSVMQGAQAIAKCVKTAYTYLLIVVHLQIGGEGAMSLQELIAEAFTRGCGTSLEQARRNPRYAELWHYLHNLGHLDAPTRSTVMHLGECLADRAFQNMPPVVHDNIHLWKAGVEGQHRLLKILCTELTSSKWQSSRQTVYDPDDIRNVLPHESGSWLEGPVQPNCIGVYGMMEGVVRKVGATYCALNVLNSYELAGSASQVRFLETMLSTLESYSTGHEAMEEVTQRLKIAVEKTQAHHRTLLAGGAHYALLVKLSDNSWWVVDPYLQTCYQLMVNEELVRIVHRNPGRVYLQRRNPGPVYDVRFAVQAETLLRLCQSLTASQNGALNVKALASLVANSRLHCMAARELSAELQGPSEDPRLQKAKAELVRSVLAECGYAEGGQQETDDLTPAWQIVASFLEAALDYARDIYSEPDSRMHAAFELAPPGLALGVATLNQIRVKRAKAGDYVMLGGALGYLLAGQWILLDDLIALGRGDVLTKRSQTEVDLVLAYLRDTQPLNMIIAPLQSLMSNQTAR